MIAVAELPTGSAMADVRKPAAAPVDDLTVATTRHVVSCPLPKLSTCVIRKPVDTDYRVLTPGVELDDKGEYWIADFAKTKDAKVLLRILGRDGDLHEIEASFSNGSVSKGHSTQK